MASDSPSPIAPKTLPQTPVTTAAAADETTRCDGARLQMAATSLRSPDRFTREAGAQALAGMTSGEALRLLEQACTDREDRVVEAGLRALLLGAATGSPEAEAALLRTLTQNSNRNRVRGLLLQGRPEQIGALRPNSFDALRFSFLAANPELAYCRLQGLTAGTPDRVQAYRSARLRANPAFAALFDVIRSDPDLPHALKPVLARRAEFVTGANGTPRSLEPFWEQSRRMTGLLAALGASPALNTLTEVMIDRSVRRASDALWDRLRRGEIPYVPEIVVGAGPHSANLCSTLATLRPDCLPLVVEQRDRIGGQFAVPLRAAWLLNSRARPASPDRRLVPGRGNALNSLGAYAPVQEADLTGQSYAAQDRLALATRMSLFLSCHALVGTVAGPYFRNDAPTRQRMGLPMTGVLNETTAPAGEYLVRLTHRDTGSIGYIVTDAILFAGGLGEPRSTFSAKRRSGSNSRRSVAGELAQSPHEEPTRYFTFDSFMARLTAPDNPFPLRGLKQVTVVGDGDSARVVVEARLGYGPPVGWSVQSLDRVERVVWIGQKSATREAFLACERPRYHLLALEFPRGETGASGSARILPIAERAVRFMVEEGQAIVQTTRGTRFASDAVIDCTGFGSAWEKQMPQPLAGLPASRAGHLRPGKRLRLCDLLRETEVVLTIQAVMVRRPDTASYRLTGVAQQVIGRSPLAAETPFTTDFCSLQEIGVALERAVQACLNLPEGTRLFLAKTVLPVVYATLNGERQPIARRKGRESIYYVGPQASLPFPQASTAVAMAGNTSGDSGPAWLETSDNPANAVALWRYAASVTTFAEFYFANLATRIVSRGEPLPRFEPAFPSQELPPAPPGEAAADRVFAPLSDRAQEALYGRGIETLGLLPGGNSQRLFRYLIWEALRRFHLPAQLRGESKGAFRLRFTPRTPQAEGDVAGIEGEVLSPENASLAALPGVALRPLVEALMTDVLLQTIIVGWAFPTRASERTGRAIPTTVDITARRGKLQLQAIWVGD